MNSTTDLTQTITLRSGRTFKVEAKDQNGTRFYILTGAKGAKFLATQAYINDDHTFKVLGGWTYYELADLGNAVRLTDKNGSLEEVR